jgi:cupin 2 domain-containing protein
LGNHVVERVKNIFADIPQGRAEETFLTLFENDAVKIQRIVSHAHKSPPGFWYDQIRDEWVMVLRGYATLEFEDGNLLRMNAGDHLFIPRRAKHRVNDTGKGTIWLAVHVEAARNR